MNEKELLAKIAELEAKNAVLSSQTIGNAKLSLKISVKGAASLYGLGRFPVTLYAPQWTRLLEAKDEISAFLTTNKEKLSQAKPVGHVTAVPVVPAKS